MEDSDTLSISDSDDYDSDSDDDEKTNVPSSQIPLIEKYRPKVIEDLVLDDFTINKLQKMVSDLSIPNLIINGRPGVGKTTTSKCLVRSLFGKYVNDAVLDLNASDDRGISISLPIEDFCKKKLDINDDTRKYAKFKVILLDEADNMTHKVQQYISTYIDKYNKTTKFIFTCNDSSNIIERIQSRCSKMEYMKISDENIVKRLKKICECENIKYEDGSLEKIAYISCGDVRAAINNLQLINNYYGIILSNEIYSISGKPQIEVVGEIFKLCMNKDFVKTLKLIYTLKEQGFQSSDIVDSMFQYIRHTNDIDELTKIKFLDKISNTCYIISKGFDNYQQMTALISLLIKTV